MKLVDNSDEEIQEEISPDDNALDDESLLLKFNWGAFLCSPLWSFVYKQWGWFALFLLLGGCSRDPSLGWLFYIIYIALAIILGKKANRIAWRVYRSKFRSIKATLQAQTKWIIPGIMLFIYGLIIVRAEYQQFLDFGH